MLQRDTEERLALTGSSLANEQIEEAIRHFLTNAVCLQSLPEIGEIDAVHLLILIEA